MTLQCANVSRRTYTLLSTIPIHSAYIPTCHPEIHMMGLSVDIRYLGCIKGLVVLSIGHVLAIPFPLSLLPFCVNSKPSFTFQLSFLPCDLKCLLHHRADIRLTSLFAPLSPCALTPSLQPTHLSQQCVFTTRTPPPPPASTWTFRRSHLFLPLKSLEPWLCWTHWHVDSPLHANASHCDQKKTSDSTIR